MKGLQFSMRSRNRLIAIFAMLSIALLLYPWASVWAQQQSTSQAPGVDLLDGSGLIVQNTLAELSLKPGDVVNHHVLVGLGRSAPHPLDITLDTRGLSMGLDGTFDVPEPGKEPAEFSARSFIRKVDPPTLHLEPGMAVPVDTTVAVPRDIPPGFRYANVYLHSMPIEGANVSVILAANILFYLNIGDAKATDTGSYTNLDVVPPVSGKPIEIDSLFHNTGDHHFRAEETLVLSDADRKTQYATMTVPNAATSILPTFKRMYIGRLNLLDHLEGLKAGKYKVNATMRALDGRVLATRSTTFNLLADYQPFPGIDPSHLKIVHFNDEVPGRVDARREADVVLDFSDTGKVTGTLVIGKYPAEPDGKIPFASAIEVGGAGATGVKFDGVGVFGFDKGTVQVTAYYQPEEIKGLDPNTLFITKRVIDPWVKLDDLGVFPRSQNTVGSMPVADLTLNPTVAIGGEVAKEGLDVLLDLLGQHWLLAGGVLVGTGGLGAAFATFIVRRRRPTDDDEDEVEGANA